MPSRRPAKNRSTALAPLSHIERSIHLVRGEKVLLDFELARLYGVPTKVLNQAVRRNASRFPEDFMFRVTEEEVDSLRSQIVTLNDAPEFKAKTTKTNRGAHRKFLPHAFTEQGVAMLSSVLRSPRAVKVNVEIMRAFVRLRQLLASNAELSKRLDELESRYDASFAVIFQAIRALMDGAKEDEVSSKRKPRIGFDTSVEAKPAGRSAPRGRRAISRVS